MVANKPKMLRKAAVFTDRHFFFMCGFVILLCSSFVLKPTLSKNWDMNLNKTNSMTKAIAICLSCTIPVKECRSYLSPENNLHHWNHISIDETSVCQQSNPVIYHSFVDLEKIEFKEDLPKSSTVINAKEDENHTAPSASSGQLRNLSMKVERNEPEDPILYFEDIERLRNEWKMSDERVNAADYVSNQQAIKPAQINVWIGDSDQQLATPMLAKRTGFEDALPLRWTLWNDHLNAVSVSVHLVNVSRSRENVLTLPTPLRKTKTHQLSELQQKIKSLEKDVQTQTSVMHDCIGFMKYRSIMEFDIIILGNL